MAEKTYTLLYIVYIILFQGIIGVFSEDPDESNFLIRKKRVINTEPGGDVPIQISDARFVVNIRHEPYHYILGVGAILSRFTVITIASQIQTLNITAIQLVVGSAYSNRGTFHDLREKHVHLGNHPHRSADGIALLITREAFIFSRNIGTIPLHTGPLLPATPATVYGWGFRQSAPRGTEYRLRLRSITLPIMRHQECVQMYRNRYVISDKDICTHDAHKCCGHTDYGAPLVVDNELAGLYLWTGYPAGDNNPDVYVMLQHQEYAQWIRRNTV